MPTSFQGIGTTFYGQRDYQPDGSYITTEFIIFGGIPLMPLKSVRVRYGGATGIVFPVAHSEERYAVLATTRPNIKQVLSIYGFIVFMICWVIALVWVYGTVEGKLDQAAVSALLFLLFVLPALLPVALRHAAKRKLKFQQAALTKAGSAGAPPASAS
jgi:magnesium-transporting ATPase (P-type)